MRGGLCLRGDGLVLERIMGGGGRDGEAGSKGNGKGSVRSRGGRERRVREA